MDERARNEMIYKVMQKSEPMDDRMNNMRALKAVGLTGDCLIEDIICKFGENASRLHNDEYSKLWTDVFLELLQYRYDNDIVSFMADWSSMALFVGDRKRIKWGKITATLPAKIFEEITNKLEGDKSEDKN